MNGINKQKFLAELGRLLTFMYEEDRRMALAMYSDMFDSCRDEDLLLQSLGSPTRQAVAIARNYNAKDRKLQLTTEERGTVNAGEVPAFMITIGDIMDEVLEGNKFSNPVDENQFSLFPDDDQPHVDFDAAVEEPAEAPAFESIPVVEASPASAPVEVAAAPAAAAPVKSEITVDDFLAGMLDDEPASAGEPVEALTEDSAVSETAAEPETEAQDPVDRFIADFSIDEEIPAEGPEAPAEEPEASAEPEEGSPAPVKSNFFEEPDSDDIYSSLYDEDDFYSEPERKADGLLLTLYIIAAIPLSLLGIAVLLVLTAVVLALSAGCIIGGLFVFSAGLGGLTMIADIMVVLGAGVALFALGLLFLWTAIWLVGGAIVGLVRGVFTLAKKWCYKEVEQ